MNFHKSLIMLVLFYGAFSLGVSFGGYWFQFGVRGGSQTASNSGASVHIQTILNHNLTSGSSGYWVGETLSNGAFIQIGYLSENESGVYPSFCTTSGCGGFQNLTAGNAEWFYEYFPPSLTGSFLGRIGPDGSAGRNGTTNNYSFYSTGSNWTFKFNGNVLGSINLGTNNSGNNIPIAFGELANSSNANVKLNDVIFKNLKFYNGQTFLVVPSGYSFIGYGEGSQTALKNPYGVSEVGNKINYFEVGSGLTQYPNNTKLWTLGYSLNINSTYGNVSGNVGYVAYAITKINVPSIVSITNGSRAIFVKWIGSGLGSYTGVSNSSTVDLDENISEQAVWQLQYYLNVASPYGTAKGSGWYNSGTTTNYSISSNIIYQNTSSRVIFYGWNNGAKNLNGRISVDSPTILSPIWKQQYYLSVNSSFGNVTGGGWYFEDSTANIYVKKPIINVTPYKKIAFYSWNNGIKTQNITLNVLNPLSIVPIYKDQYLTTFEGLDTSGYPISIKKLIINGNTTNNTMFLYSGINYTVTGVLYHGTKLPLNDPIMINSSSRINLQLPLYNVNIKTTDLFGAPVNALVTLTFYNGTTISEYSGNSGYIFLSDVPFGQASGTATYGSITTSVNAVYGNKNTMLFVSFFNIEVFISIIIISGLIYALASKRLKNEKKPKNETIISPSNIIISKTNSKN